MKRPRPVATKPSGGASRRGSGAAEGAPAAKKSRRADRRVGERTSPRGNHVATYAEEKLGGWADPEALAGLRRHFRTGRGRSATDEEMDGEQEVDDDEEETDELESDDGEEALLAQPDVFVVEALVGERYTGSGARRRHQFLVRWQGYGAKDDTWEDEEQILDDELIAEFKRGKRLSNPK